MSEEAASLVAVISGSGIPPPKLYLPVLLEFLKSVQVFERVVIRNSSL